MRQKNKVFKIIRPHEIIRRSRQSPKNIFQSPLKECQKQNDEPDHFLPGEKEMRIFKNKLKKKKKLTSAHPMKINLNQAQNTETNDVLTRQEVIDCLPKGVRLIKNLERSLNEIRTMRENHRKEWSARKEHEHECNLMKNIDGYRELIQEREQSSRLNYLPNLMSLYWIQTLREGRGTEKKGRENILVKNKMMVCETSKRKAEDKWLRDKEKSGYGFRLLPNSYLLIRDSQVTQ